MIWSFFLIICMSFQAFAQSSSVDLLCVDLLGSPTINNAVMEKSIDIYVDSEGDWELDVSAGMFKAEVRGQQIFLPPERISVRVDDNRWIEVREYPKRLCSGVGPCSLTLYYRFEPTWEDRSLIEKYQGELQYTLSSGKLFSSLCLPKKVKQGDVVRLVFSTEVLDEAVLVLYRDEKIVLEEIFKNTNEIWIETDHMWSEGHYVYEVFSDERIITRGVFEVGQSRALSKGKLEGKINSSEKLENAFLEIYNENAELVIKKEGLEALMYQIDLAEGIYYLSAGADGLLKENVGPLTVYKGRSTIKDIDLNSKFSVQASVYPKPIKLGSVGYIDLQLESFTQEPLRDISMTLTLPKGLVWSENGNVVYEDKIELLEAKSSLQRTFEFKILPTEQKGSLLLCSIQIGAKTESGHFISLEKNVDIDIRSGLFGEPGVLVGESESGLYFADGTYVLPDKGLFTLMVEPKSYGVLLGAKPYLLNVSQLSERVKLPQAQGKKAGLVELQASLNSKVAFGVKGYYDSHKVKLAFVYPYKPSKDEYLTPYPRWGTKTKILDKTPWQFQYKDGDWAMKAGTVYSTSPLSRGYSSTALYGLEAELAPLKGVQLKASAGFDIENKVCEEFLADNSTGPFVLKATPIDGTVELVVEARDESNNVIKSFLWDFYLSNHSIKLKRPLNLKDQLGLKHYIVITYLSSNPKASERFFWGGHIGYKDDGNSLYLFKHLEDEGVMVGLNHEDLSFDGTLGRSFKDVVLVKSNKDIKHQLHLINNQEKIVSYELDYTGKFNSDIALSMIDGKKYYRGEFDFAFENRLIQVSAKQKMSLKKHDISELNNEYFYYSGSLRWPNNLVWGLSREGFREKRVDTFSTKMLYKVFGFSGYVSGMWRQPNQGKPKLAVSLSHEDIPLTLKAEWEHIEPKFSLLEACFDTKTVWANISLCNERANLKKVFGLTILPKENLVFFAIKDDDLKTQVYIPFAKTQFKLSFTGDLKTKINVSELGVDLSLSKRSQIGVFGRIESGPGLKKNFRLLGSYRFKTDNLQLEALLGDRESGLYFTYLIPLGRYIQE